MELEFFVASESAAIDQSTDRLSIFNVLDVLEPEELPDVLPSLCVVTLLRARDAGDDETDWQATARITVPGDEPVDFTANFELAAGSTRHRIVQRFQNVPITAAGEIVIELLLNNRHLATHIIEVVQP